MVNKVQKSVDRLVVFEDKKIRRLFYNGEWYFSIIDIIRVLTGSSDPNRYWTELKKKLIVDEGFSQLLDKIEQLKLESSVGKKYLTDTANTETVFRIIQSIPWENLRDHMTDLELIFSMLGEASTKEIAVNRDAQGFDENKNAAKIGGKIAGDARRQLEQESGKPVISQENYMGSLISGSDDEFEG